MSLRQSVFRKCYAALLDECGISAEDRAAELAQLDEIAKGRQAVTLDTLAWGLQTITNGALNSGDHNHACIRSFLLSFTLMQKLKKERKPQEGGG